MALTFPLNLGTFFDAAKLVSTKFWLPPVAEGEETGAGEIYQVQSSPRLWEGSATFVADSHDANDAMASKANLLLSPGSTFRVRPRHRRGPVGDPNGTALGAASVTLGAVNANLRDITLNGLPANYAGLQSGSYLSFAYQGIMGFHQVVVGATATGLGVATVEVIPALRPGYAINVAVALELPHLIAVIKSGSFRPIEHRAGVSLGFSFDWRQTLRA